MTKFNAAFRKWFGDSKVVDADGNPLVVYHGTDDYFRKFNKENGLHYFTTSEDYAWCMAKRLTRGAIHHNIVKSYLSIQNILDMRDLWHHDVKHEYVAKEFKRHGLDLDAREFFAKEEYPPPWWVWVKEYKSKIIPAIIASGYDGMVMREASATCPRTSSGEIFVAFYPEQIKSVENDGTWDADDLDIRSNPEMITYAKSLGEEWPIGTIRKLYSGKHQELSLRSPRSIPYTPGNKIYATGIEKWIAVMMAGEFVPPPDLRMYRNEEYLEDGHHRTEAARQLKLKKIPVWVQID